MMPKGSKRTDPGPAFPVPESASATQGHVTATLPWLHVTAATLLPPDPSLLGLRMSPHLGKEKGARDARRRTNTTGCPLQPSPCLGPAPGQSTPEPQDSPTKPRATAAPHAAAGRATSLLCCQLLTVTRGWTLSSILQVRDSRHPWKSQARSPGGAWNRLCEHPARWQQLRGANSPS